jgi:hypothetical protein
MARHTLSSMNFYSQEGGPVFYNTRVEDGFAKKDFKGKKNFFPYRRTRTSMRKKEKY